MSTDRLGDWIYDSIDAGLGAVSTACEWAMSVPPVALIVILLIGPPVLLLGIVVRGVRRLVGAN